MNDYLSNEKNHNICGLGNMKSLYHIFKSLEAPMLYEEYEDKGNNSCRQHSHVDLVHLDDEIESNLLIPDMIDADGDENHRPNGHGRMLESISVESFFAPPKLKIRVTNTLPFELL